MPPVRHPANPRRSSRWRLLALALATAAGLPPGADAQTTAPAPTGAAALLRADDAMRYRVDDRRAPGNRRTARKRRRPRPLAGLRGHDRGPLRPSRARRDPAGARGGRHAGLLLRGRGHRRRPRDAARHRAPRRSRPARRRASPRCALDVMGPARDVAAGRGRDREGLRHVAAPAGRRVPAAGVDGRQEPGGGDARGERVCGGQADGAAKRASIPMRTAASSR